MAFHGGGPGSLDSRAASLSMRVLFVEDSQRLRDTVSRALARCGHAVDQVPDGEAASVCLGEGNYDVMVLDLMLPGRSGLEWLEQWRKKGIDVPVIVLTALGAIENRLKGFALGADDYLTKPFSIEELVARIEAIGRRARGQVESRLTLGRIEIDLAGKVVRLAGEVVPLTAREYSLLECLARRPGRIFSREQIEAYLYSETDSPVSNAVDAAVYSLRKKLCPPGEKPVIQTRRGLGYLIEAP